MSKGRRAPTPVIINPPPLSTSDYRRAMAADEAFFKANPTAKHCDRAYIPGEASPDQPPGTLVHVMRIGYQRVRCFTASKMEGCN